MESGMFILVLIVLIAILHTIDKIIDYLKFKVRMSLYKQVKPIDNEFWENDLKESEK